MQIILEIHELPSSSLSTQRSHHVHKIPKMNITYDLHLHSRKFVKTLKNVPLFHLNFFCFPARNLYWQVRFAKNCT